MKYGKHKTTSQLVYHGATVNAAAGGAAVQRAAVPAGKEMITG